MEVKKHHHAVPIALTLAALVALAAVALNHLTSGQYDAAQALISHPFDIQPAPNGLVNVTAHQPPTIQTGPDWTQAGSTASLTLSIN